MSIARDAALRAFIPHVGPRDVVVAVYQTNFDWIALNPRPLNYVAVGAMGQALSHGLGLALAHPDRKIFVFDGDGSLLMNLGALVTTAGANVANLSHFVFVNRTYEVNGGHPIPNAKAVDFAGFAEAAGFPSVFRQSEEAVLIDTLPKMLATPGPRFCALEVHAGAPYPRDYSYIHGAAARQAFAEALRTT
ncbi:MAG: thiamine pyrophosphate-dependent enzyme [Pseudomonadota bacterium]